MPGSREDFVGAFKDYLTHPLSLHEVARLLGDDPEEVAKVEKASRARLGQVRPSGVVRDTRKDDVRGVLDLASQTPVMEQPAGTVDAFVQMQHQDAPSSYSQDAELEDTDLVRLAGAEFLSWWNQVIWVSKELDGLQSEQARLNREVAAAALSGSTPSDLEARLKAFEQHRDLVVEVHKGCAEDMASLRKRFAKHIQTLQGRSSL